MDKGRRLLLRKSPSPSDRRMDPTIQRLFLRHCTAAIAKEFTAKAVMLDEIINYVQSLQWQVEVNMEVMDLIEILQKHIKEENGESSTKEGSDGVEKAGEDVSDAEKAEEDRINDDDDDDEAEEETKSDAEEEGLSNEKTYAMDNKSKEVSDVIEEKKRYELAKFKVHAVNSEMEEDSEEDSQSPVKASQKRKQIVARKGAGKKARKSVEVRSGVEDVKGDQKMQDAEGSCIGNHISPKHRGRLRKNQIQGNESSPLSPCTKSIRITR